MSELTHELNKLKFYLDNDQLQNALDILVSIEKNNMDVSDITDKELSSLEGAIIPKKAFFGKILSSFENDSITPQEDKYLQNKIKTSALYNGTMVYEFLTNPKLFNAVQKSLDSFDT